MRQPRKARRDRPSGNMAVMADRYQPRRQQEFADFDARAIRGHARDIRLDDLLLTGCAVGQRNEIDLDDSAHRGERLGRHNRYRARDVGVVLVPRVETVGRVLDIGEVYLGLQRLLQR